MAETIDLRARERLKGYVPVFYQSIALPNELLDWDLDNKLDCGNFRPINQWRIDYPTNLRKEIPEKHKALLSIAHKILTRGEYTTLSPDLEKRLDSKFTNKGEFNPYAYDLINDSNNSTFWFDGAGYEKKFFETVLPEVLGNSFKKFVIPQVEFHSLVYDYDKKSESKESKERVDFLITTNKSKIVVELDGEEHESHKSKDSSRKKRLNEKGYKEIRIKNSEIDDFNSKGIQELKKEFSNISFNETKKSEYDKYLNSFKLVHQFQITLLDLLFEGIINCSDKNIFCYDFNSFKEYNDAEIKYIIEEALIDLKQLLSKLSELYNIPFDINKLKLALKDENAITLTYYENIETNNPLCIIQAISFPKRILKELKTIENIKITTEIKDETLEYFLNYIFGYDSFWEGQLDSLKRVLLNQDTITLLPTGAGKSLIFQLATLILPGVSVIIVPIKSLMQDQVENLERKGISRAIALSGDIEGRREKEKIQRMIDEGHYLLIYVAPERFLIDEFRNSLREFTKKFLISLIVIDEAHCVSEWGHDFRPAYLTVGKNSRIYCKNKDGSIPPLIALTGTASENVLLDVKKDLEVEDADAIISPETFDRKELHFNIIKCNSGEKYKYVKEIFEKELPEKLKTKTLLESNGKSTKSGIIFCPFTTNRKTNPRGVEFFIERIKEDFGDICEPYHSRETNRIINARNFQENKFPLLIATKGYGMGIDKPNIRYIIHINLPPSVEAFYQEAGRAGRDGEQSECFVVYSCDADKKNNPLLKPNTPLDEIKEICASGGKWDDLRSLYYFHNSTFKGKKDELDIIKGILDDIGDLNKEYQPYSSKFNNIALELSDDELFKAKQKAIFRLTAIGVVTNYGVDYASNEFSLKIDKINKEEIIRQYYNYVKKYNHSRAKTEREKLENKKDLQIKDFIIYCCELFLGYVYDYYEKGRRQAISTMHSSLEEALNSDNPDKIFREEVSNYLKRTYSKQLNEIANPKNLSIMEEKIEEIFKGPHDVDSLIKPVSDLKSLSGQISRTMEDFPESNGLFLLRARVKVELNGRTDNKGIVEDIEQFLMLSKNHFSKKEIYPILCRSLLEIIKIRENQGFIDFIIAEKLIDKVNDEELTWEIIKYMDNENVSFDYGKLKLIKGIYKDLEDKVYGGIK